MSRSFYIILIILVLLVMTGCRIFGNDSNGDKVEIVLPLATVSISDGSAINGTTPIVLSFDKAMDIATLLLGGTMSAASDGGVWSTNTLENDTLTISPASAWAGGEGTLVINVKDNQGNALAELILSYTSDATAPTVTLNVVDGETINNTKQFILSFSEAMDVAALLLGGTLADQSDAGVWSQTTAANDTLTISPATAWTSGSGTLQVDVSDLAGNAVASQSISVVVDAQLPSATPSPVNGSTIGGGAAIDVTYSEQMDPASVSVTTTLNGSTDVANSLAWSSNAQTNDTLTVTPATSWPEGSLAAAIAASDLVGNSVSTDLTYTVDLTAPLVDTVNPASGSTIPEEQVIVINFNESMDPASINLTGTMSGNAALPVVMSTTTVANDTLTISPTTLWTVSAARTLNVDGSDVAGNPLATLNLSFDVEVDTDKDGHVDSLDCAPNDAAIHPGAVEVCDGVDNNCAGGIDEGVQTSFYLDADGDNFGDPGNSVAACVAPGGYVVDNTDCDDFSPNRNPGLAEVCDGIDNNCSGAIDEGVLITYYRDFDADTYGDAMVSQQECAAPAGFVADDSDCDDTDGAVNPGAVEVCDGLDNDCAGGVDDGVSITYYADSDSDTYGDPTVSQQACSLPLGYVVDGSDCDDGEAAVNPGATEVCDGIDNDCAGGIDDGVSTTYYADSDNDTYGDPMASQQACSLPLGYVVDNTDCDDADMDVHPAADEICDSQDNDCDGLSDDADPGVTGLFTWYEDQDGDTYGDPVGATAVQCAQPIGFELDDTDCNDGSSEIYPGALEICDGIDNDCDAVVDDACVPLDVCGDGTPTGAEECDDGNTNSGDGCSSTCMSELPVADGESCAINSDCINGSCNSGGICGFEGCAANSDACFGDAECCSGSCYVAFGICEPAP